LEEGENADLDRKMLLMDENWVVFALYPPCEIENFLPDGREYIVSVRVPPTEKPDRPMVFQLSK
jgi:hypothetical protein